MVKTIFIKATIEGSGIVNFDSNDQKFAWNRQKNVEKYFHNNAMFGKGRYYLDKKSDDEEKEYLTKIAVISSDCIRHAMFDDDMFIHLPNIMHDNKLLMQTIARPAFIERGYMFAKTNPPLKRKSSFTISYAKAIQQSVSALETYSNTQPKTGKNKTEESAETSFFKREVRGESVYSLEGQIDIREMGFISMSDVHDRMNVYPDLQLEYRTFLKEKIGSDISEPFFYQKVGDSYGIPEYGIHLTETQIKFLIMDILKRLAGVNINRITGNARTISVSIKFVNDPIEDRFNNENGWINIWDDNKFNVDCLNNIILDVGYVKVDLQEEAKQKIENYKKKFGYVEEKKEKPSKEKEKEKENKSKE